MQVHITFDIEVWCNNWQELDARFPAAFQRYVYGESKTEGWALPQTLAILQRHGLQGVFFVEPLFSARFGEQHLLEIVSLIATAGQDVQLHLHTEWTDEITPPLIADSSLKRQHLQAYSLDEQTALIGWGKKALERCLQRPVTAFRAGSFAANRASFDALAANGILIDSSLNCVADISAPDVPQRLTTGSVTTVGGVTSYPISVFEDGWGRLRPAQVGACSFEELRDALDQAEQTGREHFVIVSHNFEMLKVDSAQRDPIVARRFERLCAYLAQHPNRFQVGALPPANAIPERHEPRPRVGRWPTAKRLVEQAWRRLG